MVSATLDVSLSYLLVCEACNDIWELMQPIFHCIGPMELLLIFHIIDITSSIPRNLKITLSEATSEVAKETRVHERTYRWYTGNDDANAHFESGRLLMTHSHLASALEQRLTYMAQMFKVT